MGADRGRPEAAEEGGTSWLVAQLLYCRSRGGAACTVPQQCRQIARGRGRGTVRGRGACVWRGAAKHRCTALSQPCSQRNEARPRNIKLYPRAPWREGTQPTKFATWGAGACGACCCSSAWSWRRLTRYRTATGAHSRHRSSSSAPSRHLSSSNSSSSSSSRPTSRPGRGERQRRSTQPTRPPQNCSEAGRRRNPQPAS